MARDTTRTQALQRNRTLISSTPQSVSDLSIPIAWTSDIPSTRGPLESGILQESRFGRAAMPSPACAWGGGRGFPPTLRRGV